MVMRWYFWSLLGMMAGVSLLAMAPVHSPAAHAKGGAARLADPTPVASTPSYVRVVLPASIDPTRTARMLKRGTQIYRIPFVMAHYDALRNGESISTSTTIEGFDVRAELKPDAVYVTTDVGLGYKLPYSVTFYRAKGYVMAVREPGTPLPHYLANHTPDYVVP